jgi:hypothetical protein
MNESTSYIVALIYLLIAFSVTRYFRKLGNSWTKSFLFGILWPITMLLEWLRQTSAVLKNDETMKEFFGKLNDKKVTEEVKK